MKILGYRRWAAASSPLRYSVDGVNFQEILKSLLNQVIISCGHCIRTFISQRTFELCYPRLITPSSQKFGWEEGEKVVLNVLVSHVHPVSEISSLNTARKCIQPLAPVQINQRMILPLSIS